MVGTYGRTLPWLHTSCLSVLSPELVVIGIKERFKSLGKLLGRMQFSELPSNSTQYTLWEKVRKAICIPLSDLCRTLLGGLMWPTPSSLNKKRTQDPGKLHRGEQPLHPMLATLGTEVNLARGGWLFPSLLPLLKWTAWEGLSDQKECQKNSRVPAKVHKMDRWDSWCEKSKVTVKIWSSRWLRLLRDQQPAREESRTW